MAAWCKFKDGSKPMKASKADVSRALGEQVGFKDLSCKDAYAKPGVNTN